MSMGEYSDLPDPAVVVETVVVIRLGAGQVADAVTFRRTQSPVDVLGIGRPGKLDNVANGCDTVVCLINPAPGAFAACA